MNNTPEPNNYWKYKPTRYSVDKTKGVLIGNTDKFGSLIDCVIGAGIPRKMWDLIEEESDYSNCYYEDDKPEMVWTFPINVFDEKL